MADPMRIRVTEKDGLVTVRVLMSHEMETGLRKDTSGNIVPAHFIRNVTATCQGRTVLSAQWGTAVSKNPFLEFSFKGGRKGDKVVITWEDNKGDKRSDEAIIG